MSKGSKIMIVAVIAVIAVSISVFAISTAIRNNAGQTTEPAASSASGSSAEATTVPSAGLSSLILGKWVDSANMSGYEFLPDGTVNVTYVNLTIPVVNIPISGEAKGTYAVSGDNLEVHFSIYSGNIDIFYTATVKDNTLTLVTVDKEDTATYIRDSSGEATTLQPTTTQPAPSASEEESLTGSWKSSDNNVEYVFFENGTVEIRFFGDDSSAAYSGVYVENGDSLTIQYTAAGEKVTNEYSYKLSGLSLSLTSSTGETTLFVKTAGESEKLLGKWEDSSKMSGFEFKENGVVEVTYINLTIPVVNIPINGKFTGSYTVSGNSITINYSIYSNAISETYYYSIDGSALTLTSVSDGEISTYVKA